MKKPFEVRRDFERQTHVLHFNDGRSYDLPIRDKATRRILLEEIQQHPSPSCPNCQSTQVPCLSYRLVYSCRPCAAKRAKLAYWAKLDDEELKRLKEKHLVALEGIAQEMKRR